MTSTAVCLTWLVFVSKELFAEARTRPSTSAVMVPMSPIPTLTTSRDSGLRCCSGSVAPSSMPSSTPAQTHAKMISEIATALTLGSEHGAQGHHRTTELDIDVGVGRRAVEGDDAIPRGEVRVDV